MNPQTPKEKNSKGGRPKKPENELRLYPVKVYFDEANFRKLQNRSKRTGLSLSGMANNLTQLARQANTFGYQAAAMEVSEVVGKIDNLLIRISEK